MSLLMGFVLVESGVTLLIMMDLGPLHMLAMKLVRLANSGHVGILVRILAGGTLICLLSTLNGIYKIRRRTLKIGSPTSADHFIMRTYLLDSFLMGFSLLLFLVINKLHHQVNKIESLKLNVETLQKQSEAVRSEYQRLEAEKHAPIWREHAKAQEEIVSLKDLVAALRTKMENLQLESLEKDKVVKTAEANARALQKQSQGFLLEYDRLLEDNESLRNQLVSMDRRLSHSDTKKHA